MWRVASIPPKSPPIQDAVARAESRLGDRGRMVLRPSGTEPVIRVMVEGRDEERARAAMELRLRWRGPPQAA